MAKGLDKSLEPVGRVGESIWLLLGTELHFQDRPASRFVTRT
jgi:hypothetical protein